MRIHNPSSGLGPFFIFARCTSDNFETVHAKIKNNVGLMRQSGHISAGHKLFLWQVVIKDDTAIMCDAAPSRPKRAEVTFFLPHKLPSGLCSWCMAAIPWLGWLAALPVLSGTILPAKTEPIYRGMPSLHAPTTEVGARRSENE